MLSAVTALGWFCLGLSGVVIAVLLLVFVLKRLLGWLDDLGYITYTGHVPTWGSLGNAAMEVQKLAQPEYEYVLEHHEDEKQKKEEEDEGGPDRSGLR